MEDILMRMREMLPDIGSKRRRNSNCPESGPPRKTAKNVQGHRIVRDELRQQPSRTSFLRSMGSIFSKFKSHSNGCEPTEREEYSDGEDVIVLQKFKKSHLTAPRHPPINNYQFDKMDAVNNISSANRPPPGLIHKAKWHRLPDLQKILSQPRVNGYQHETDTVNSTRNHVVNGTTLSYKSHNSQHIDSAFGKSYCVNPALATSRCPSLMSLKPINSAAEDKLRFERMLRSAIPDYCVAEPSPTSKRPTTAVLNHISSRPPLRTSRISLLDDELFKKHEDVRQRFAEASITSERKVTPATPVNTMRMKTESSLVCKKQYPDIVKEKYSPAIAQRYENISQQEETTKQLTYNRMKHRKSYENLKPAWYTPRIVIFDEDIEEKIDDFPEFTDAHRQTIRQAMVGNPSTTLISKFGYQITRSHIQTLQWEPSLAWLNDQLFHFYCLSRLQDSVYRTLKTFIFTRKESDSLFVEVVNPNMDVQARIAAKAQIKSVQLYREDLLRSPRIRSRLLETDVGEILAKVNEPVNAYAVSKLNDNLQIPHFVKRPIDTYIVAHRTGMIEARVTGVPDAEIVWYKNWNHIIESPRIKMHHYAPNTYVLEIRDAIASDTALYTCVARNCCGCVTSSATIRVVHIEIEEYPRFAKRLESIDVSAGHNGHLEVKVTGIPKPEIKWFKNWIPLKEDHRIEFRHYDPDSYVLNIYNAQPDDSGLYTCKARNDSGSITTSAMVHVEGNNDLYLYKSLIPRPYHCYYDAGWLEDFVNIRRRLERLAYSLSKKERDELLHQRALANYYAKLRRPSIDYYDLL